MHFFLCALRANIKCIKLFYGQVKEDRQSLTMNSDDDEMASHVWHTGNDLSVAYTPKSVSEVIMV